jgi:integrase
MTCFGLLYALLDVAEKAGVHGVTVHIMRRTFATLATEYGAPSRLVQAASRWKDISVVDL